MRWPATQRGEASAKKIGIASRDPRKRALRQFGAGIEERLLRKRRDGWSRLATGQGVCARAAVRSWVLQSEQGACQSQLGPADYGHVFRGTRNDVRPHAPSPPANFRGVGRA
jgi:hypothetical protein